MIKNNLQVVFKKTVFKYLLFWSVVFVYYLSISWPYEINKLFLIEAVLFDLILQVIIAFLIIRFLIPKLLNKNKKALFFVSSIFIIYTAFVSYSAFRCFYLAEVFSNRPSPGFLERITDVYAFLRSLASYISPAFVLVIFNYYKQQKETATLLEQKKSSELDALKNQLNPHFLFNTLNNLYTLALKKSDEAPVAIAKLSGILDYILYRCKNNFVALSAEVTLLHNYIGLEKIRYKKRVELTFVENIEGSVQIAPLLLLTFLENAFKHGVSQEINTAKIDICIIGNSKLIEFNIENTKPVVSRGKGMKNHNSIGLQNIKKQLDLLYPNSYSLDIKDISNKYSVDLKIFSNDL